MKFIQKYNYDENSPVFLIIGLTVCTFCKAQDIPVLPQEKFRHHEFSVSYGFLPITDANSMAEECFAPVLSFGVYTRERQTTTVP